MSATFWALYTLIWVVASISAILLKFDFHKRIAEPMGKKATLTILWKSYTKKEIFFTLSMGTNLTEAYQWYSLLVFFYSDESVVS